MVCSEVTVNDEHSKSDEERRTCVVDNSQLSVLSHPDAYVQII